MKFYIIFYLLIVSSMMILVTCSSKSPQSSSSSYTDNCLSRTASDFQSKDLMNLYLKLPHRLIRHKNSVKAMCIIEKYLNKKQNLMAKISNKNNRPYKWNNKRNDDFEWI